MVIASLLPAIHADFRLLEFALRANSKEWKQPTSCRPKVAAGHPCRPKATDQLPGRVHWPAAPGQTPPASPGMALPPFPQRGPPIPMAPLASEMRGCREGNRAPRALFPSRQGPRKFTHPEPSGESASICADAWQPGESDL
jgi:hypothetical protein